MSIPPVWCSLRRQLVRHLLHPAAWLPAIVCLAAFCSASWLPAQEEAPEKEKPKTVTKKATKDKEKAPKDKDAEGEILPPEDQTLTTGDGLKMMVTFYPGTKGKDSIPVVLLHAFKGSRKDYAGLATMLQENLGCAVLVPDLRGHGDSTTLRIGRRDETLDAAKMPNAQFLMMAKDMKAIKNFLWDKNNEGELNIDKLCVVGAEMGSTLALLYAVYDAVGYEEGIAQYGPLKLGRFVKGLVLISPEESYKGLMARPALKNPEVVGGPSVMILVGKGTAKAFQEAKRINAVFEKNHPAPPEDKKDQKSLYFLQYDTSLQGIKLLEEKSQNVQTHIMQFINRRLVKNPEAKNYVWKARKHPHE
jgi:pimeloyl-ACP methyl ester carboxylesterase